MGSADDKLRLSQIPSFVKSLRNGLTWCRDAGCRWVAGTFAPERCQFLHRWWGNPMFSRMAQWWFATPVHDIYCGMRGLQNSFMTPGPALHRYGICDRDDYQVQHVPGEDGRSSHYPASGWAQSSCAAPAHVFATDGGRFDSSDVQPEMAVFMPGLLLILLGLVGYAVASGPHRHWSHVRRRTHCFLRPWPSCADTNPCCLRFFKDLCDQRRPDAGRSRLERFFARY